MLKRCVLRLRLKLGRVFVDLTDSGRLFQTIGPATKKARPPDLVRVRGTNNSKTYFIYSVVIGENYAVLHCLYASV